MRMSIYSEIELVLTQYHTEETPYFAGSRINAGSILWISGLFPQLNLHDEELLVASFFPDQKASFLLTSGFLHLYNQGAPIRIPIKDINEEVLQGKTIPKDTEVILKVTELVLNTRNSVRSTLDGFLERFSNFAEKQKNNFENPELFFDGKYLEMLNHEADELVRLCDALNQDAHFIQSLNIIFNNTGEAADGIRAGHLMIADLIKSYKIVTTLESEKGMFTLAFFFERLKGNNFTKGISIDRLNELASSENFRKNIEKIKNANLLNVLPEYKDEFLLPSILFRMESEFFTKSGNLIYRFASLIAKADGTINDTEKEALRKILAKTTAPKIKSGSAKSTDIPADDTLEKVLSELNSLVGLEEVKKSISDLINLIKVEKIRQDKNLKNIEISLHSVFMGPPGTGKTTVARLLGRIYHHLGYLEKGHLIETDRAGLVAGFVGQTALKVNDIVNESMGGVLFIDEAYSLAVDDGGRDFGKEATDTLVKRMEDLRKELVVVVAGYTEPLKYFIESNPGLRSRFNRFFMFNHFLPQQLLEIMNAYCRSGDFSLSQSASEKLLETFEMMYEKRDEGFGNARVVRNVFERCIQNQANRLVSIPELTTELLQTIEEVDVPEPKYMLEQVFITKTAD